MEAMKEARGPKEQGGDDKGPEPVVGGRRLETDRDEVKELCMANALCAKVMECKENKGGNGGNGGHGGPGTGTGGSGGAGGGGGGRGPRRMPQKVSEKAKLAMAECRKNELCAALLKGKMGDDNKRDGGKVDCLLFLFWSDFVPGVNVERAHVHA